MTGSALAATSRTRPGSAPPPRPSADGHGLPRAHAGEPVFGHREHHVARPVLGDPHDRRAGRDHLAGLGVDAGDHAGGIGHEPRVLRLVALRGRLGPGLFERGFGGLQRGRAPVELGAADEVLRLERGKALVIRRRQIPLGLRRCHLGTRRVRGQLVVARIDLRQHLAGLHALSEFRLPLDDLARHAEAQARFDAGAHFAGIFRMRVERRRADGEQLDRAHGLRRRLLSGTGPECQDRRDGGDHGPLPAEHGLPRKSPTEGLEGRVRLEVRGCAESGMVVPEEGG